MADLFEDVVVTGFTASEADRDPVYAGVFNFHFLLSRSAPPPWVQNVDERLGGGKRANIVVGHEARAYADRIVVRCPADKAQAVMDKLNKEVLPRANAEYRREVADAQRRQRVKLAQQAQQAQQQTIQSDVDQAIRVET